MPRKSLAPAFVVVNYTAIVNSITLPHQMIIPVNVAVWAGDSTNIIQKGGGNQLWSTAVGTFLATIVPMYHTSSVFSNYELWRQDSASSDPVLISIFTPAGLVGTSGGIAVLGGGTCYAFRSTEDSAYRLILIESNQGYNQRLAYASLSATQKAPVDYLLGSTSLLYARSNAYLATFGILTSKCYDKVRKKRLGM